MYIMKDLNIKFMQIKLNENDRKIVTHKTSSFSSKLFPSMLLAIENKIKINLHRYEDIYDR